MLLFVTMCVPFSQLPSSHGKRIRTRFCTPRQRPRAQSPSTARKRENLGRQKLTSTESRFSRIRCRLPCHNHPPRGSAAAIGRGECARRSAPKRLPPSLPHCLAIARPRARSPTARMGRAGAGGGPAQANFSARRQGARPSRGSRRRALIFFASTDCLRSNLPGRSKPTRACHLRSIGPSSAGDESHAPLRAPCAPAANHPTHLSTHHRPSASPPARPPARPLNTSRTLSKVSVYQLAQPTDCAPRRRTETAHSCGSRR
jgi:hypothetical protein